MEQTRAKPAKQLHLSVGANFKSDSKLKILYQQSIGRDVDKDSQRYWSTPQKKDVYRKIVSDTPPKAKPEQSWQKKTCLQCRMKVQRRIPKRQASICT